MKPKLSLVLIIWMILFAIHGNCMSFLSNIVDCDTINCAVVLYSGAKYSMEAKFINFAVRKAYHKKIQILSDEGLKYSFVDIPYHRFMEYSETVGGIQVSVTDADGGNMRVMDNGFVRDIDIDGNYKRKQFTVPDVHPGDIIDIRYEIVGVFPQYYEKQVDSTSNFDDFGFMTRTGTGDDIILPAWDFQDEIPVVKSELEFVYFDEYRFDAIITGGDNVVKEEQQGGVYKRMNRQVVKRKYFTISSPGNIDTEVKKENVNSHMSKFQGYFTEKNLKKMKFTASNLSPIIKSEKYVINPDKYRTSVEFDFKGKYAKYEPGKVNGIMDDQAIVGGDFNYASSWTDVSKILFDSRFFGRKIFYSQNFYKSYADSVSNLSISDYEKVKMICTHIRNDIKCTSKNGGMLIYSLRNTYAKKNGSNVDICAIAYKTLEKAGFNPKMIMLKSRDKGHLYNGGVSVGALNAVVVYIPFKDGRLIIFDPTGNPVDTRLINPMYLVKEGIVYNKGEAQINLMNAIENKEYHNAALFVEANGMVSGNCRSIFTNHSAYEMEGVAPNINAEEGKVRYGTLDSLTSQYTREFNFTRTSAIKVDNKIFVNPFAEIYFSAEEFAGERTYPVEFRNPKTIEYAATIHIPDGYEVYDLPQKVSWQQPNCGASATILTKAQGKIVQFGVTIKLDNATIPLKQYKDFQQWWMQMCTLFDEMIILRKKGDSSFTDTEKMTA